MKRFSIIDITRQATIASLYVVLVFIFQWISFEAIQFRVAELLLLLILFDKKSIFGLTLGVFVANLFSPLLLYDITFGVIASVITMLLMILFRKRPYIALLFPSLINAPIIGLMLHLITGAPFLITLLYVFIGQFVVTYIIGLPVYYLLKKLNFQNIYFFEEKTLE